MITSIHRILILGAIVGGSVVGAAQSRPFRPVTDATLKSPSPSDWIAWRGSPRSDGYSSLTQINRSNVSQLRLAWAWAMEPGWQQATPLVYDGVMYLPNPGGTLQALDGETGELIWEYRTPVAGTAPRSPRITKGLALYDDKLFMTWETEVIAVDARSGVEAWRTTVADPTKGFQFAAGPIAARGKIIVGLAGCQRFIEEKCAIVGLEAATGKEVWRTLTIPGAGEPGAESWGTVEPLFRSGADMWISGSYDPDLNLVYWATGQAKPWARFARGTDGDALYSNTTFALNPETGKIVWYRQTLPGETHDLDEVFESVLVDVGPRKSLFKMGKIGILWEMDRVTGRIVRATDLGLQNLVVVDPATGAVRYREDKIPKAGVVVDQCPSWMGFKNWPAMAYSPETRALYIPHHMTCANTTFTNVEKKPGGGGVGVGPAKYYLPASSQGHAGALTAIDLSGKVLWQYRHRAPVVASALATGGGLVFAGTYDRYLFAFDAKTGTILWQLRAATSVQGYPVSYAVRGRQYLAVPVGTGSMMLASHERFEGLVPGMPRPRPGNSIMVFALPQESRSTR